MKTFYDLTEEEKTSLTDDQVKYYTTLECANRGIIIPQKPISEVKEVISPTSRFYSIGYESVLFDNEEDVKAYIELVSRAYNSTGVTGSYSSTNYYAKKKDASSLEIKNSLYYTEDEAKSIKQLMTQNLEIKKEWESYNTSLTEYNKVERDIVDEIDEINYKNSRIEHYNKIYNDYLTLADNNDKMAYTFFKKAYGNLSLNDIDKEIVDDLLIRDEVITQ